MAQLSLKRSFVAAAALVVLAGCANPGTSHYAAGRAPAEGSLGPIAAATTTPNPSASISVAVIPPPSNPVAVTPPPSNPVAVSPSVSVAASTTPTPPTPSASPVDFATPPHFGTPDAAMQYLVAAYNAHDLRAEMHVTTPDARAQLESERQWVNTFSFDNCQVDGTVGDYLCTFDMASMVAPPSSPPTPESSVGSAGSEMGEITVLVAPALTPGWYMYASEGCGD